MNIHDELMVFDIQRSTNKPWNSKYTWL